MLASMLLVAWGVSGCTGSGPADTGTTDTGVTDTASHDTGATDTGTTDTGTTDTSATDTGTTDTSATDTGATDTGTTDTGDTATCGDTVCDASENATTCAYDCHCGDDTCDPLAEDATTCAADCSCGDGVCDPSESDISFAADCGCGNGVCTPESGENVGTCADDCYCSDGVCDPTETADSCPDDCSCGDGICDASESLDSCWQDCRCGIDVSCGERLDCAGDNIDVDYDGVADEDTCTNPPTVACTAACDTTDPDCIATDTVQVRADANGDFTPFTLGVTESGTIAGSLWTVESAPAGAVQQVDGASDGATFTPLIAGDYTLRYTAWDDKSQTVACETTVHAQPAPGIHVMMTWDTHQPGDDSSDVDLHLMDPAATAWFGGYDNLDDCYYSNCVEALGDTVPWGAVLDIDDTTGWGPENTRLESPADGTYTVGVHYYTMDGHAAADVIVVIYCGGVEAYRTTLQDFSNPDPQAADDCDPGTSMWLVADVVWSGTSCTVNPLGCVTTADNMCTARYPDACNAR